MRPLELQLEGFTSFRNAQRIDFAPLDLFAITGPTGAGKSSLLDAMTFALYGLTLRSGKIAGEVVSQGAQALKVSFRFAVRGGEYRATRTWRYRPSTPETKVLLEKKGGSGWETVESRALAAQKAIETLLGMDFDTFTRVIVLPQGQFDAFLKGDPAKRRELLRQLAGLDVFERMRQAASERLRSAKARREALDHQLGGLGVPEAEKVAEAEAALAACERERPAAEAEAAGARRTLEDAERLVSAWERLERARAELQTLLLEGAGLGQLREKLAGAEKATPLEPRFAALQEARVHWKRTRSERDAASARRAEAEAAEAEALARQAASQPLLAERATALEAQAAALAKAEGLASTLAGARAEAEAAARAAAQRDGELGEARSAADRHERALPEGERAFTEAQAAFERAEADLAEAERQEREQARLQAALAIAHGLHAGDDCPVCGGVFERAPDAPGAPDLDAASKALAAAKARFEGGRRALAAAEGQLRDTRAALELARAKAQHAEAAASDARATLAGRKEALDRLELAVRELLGDRRPDELKRAHAAETAALKGEQEAVARAVSEAGARRIEAEAALRTHAEGLAFAERQGKAAAGAWAEALEAAGWTEAEFQAACAPASDQAAWRARLNDFATRRSALEATIRELGETLGERVAEPGAIAIARAALAAAEARLAALRERENAERGFLAVAREKLAQAAELAAERERAGADERVWLVLSRDLKADAFQDYVLEHLQLELVSRASALLAELTESRYALAVVDNAFVVEDHWNGGERRPVRTLSGGETFAASIAMALALSEKLAAGAELGALFLDEGFGTLDPETLEAVTQVLETLRQNDRMIGVITHVRALGERLPTQLAIRKEPGGAVVSVVTA